MRVPWKTLLLSTILLNAFQLAHAADEVTIQTASLPSFVLASSTSTASGSASKTSSATATTYTVQVGNGDHKFKPDVIQAAPGDVVEFDFFPANHSVVRAEYKFPCIPYEMTGAGKQGFFSGFHPVDAVLSSPPHYYVTVNNTSPIFFYCSAPGSCLTYGMVGVINPNATTSLETHRKIALDSDYMLNPGEPFPAESPTPSGLTSNSTSSTASQPEHVDGAGEHGKLGAGAIAGIVMACIGVVVLGSMLFFFWGRFRGLKDEVNRKASSVTRNTTPRSPSFSPWVGAAGSHHPQPQPHNAHSPGASLSPQPSDVSPGQSPMSAHAIPAGPIPPSYFHRSATPTTPAPLPPNYTPHPRAFSPSASAHGSLGAIPVGQGISRTGSTASHRSGGGTFDISQTTGQYTRVHEGGDIYKYAGPRTSDMTSPVDPSLVPQGGYMENLQRLAVTNAGAQYVHPSERDVYGAWINAKEYMKCSTSSDGKGSGSPAPPYYESSTGRPLTYHVNQGQGPAEMDDTSTPPPI